MNEEHLKKTLLHNYHSSHEAKFIDFASWHMPLHYGSQVDEHHWVRKEAGIFDVSHMASILLQGVGTKELLRYLLCSDVARLQPGRGFYTCFLSGNGGVLDDLIAYQLEDEHYLLVVNAGTTAKNLDWLSSHNSQGILISLQADYCIFALQGPCAREWFRQLFPEHGNAFLLERFSCIFEKEIFIACTGYTGEDGYELIIPPHKAFEYWQRLVTKFHPCGLGCRDTLRLEAGLSLFGNELDEQHTPLESGLSWTVHWDDEKRDFIGKKTLNGLRKEGAQEKMVGLVLNGKGIMRQGNRVLCSSGEGVVTSGSFSPTLKKSIALARIPQAHHEKGCEVEIRGKKISASISKPSFLEKQKKMS